MQMRIATMSVMFAALLLLGQHVESATTSQQPLARDEMAIPAGRYQNGIDMAHTCRVGMNAPQSKPTLKWKVKPTVTNDYTDIMVDGEGGIWYPDGDPEDTSSYKIVRLKPDGSEDWERDLFPDRDQSQKSAGQSEDIPDASEREFIRPVVACNGAVICHAALESWPAIEDRITNGALPTGKAFLQCLDLKGNTRWRTDQMEFVEYNMVSWRGDEDRLIAIASQTSLNVYSLADGSYVRTVAVPGWTSMSGNGPIPIPGGDWILHSEFVNGTAAPYLSRIRPDGLVVWTITNFSQYSFSQPVTYSDAGLLLYGNGYGISAFDVGSGKELWYKYDAINFPCGVTPDGNFVVVGWTQNGTDERSHARELDPQGNEVWATEAGGAASLILGNSFIIYQDGCMLFGDAYGLHLLEKNGSVRWTVSPEDLGYPAGRQTEFSSINPAQDGGLVVSVNGKAEDNYKLSIFGLSL